MLPTLVTIGAGLAWLATTLGNLFLWGIGVGFGLWAANKITGKIDRANYSSIAARLRRGDPVYATTTAVPA
jgi:hypothetical protein